MIFVITMATCLQISLWSLERWVWSLLLGDWYSWNLVAVNINFTNMVIPLKRYSALNKWAFCWDIWYSHRHSFTIIRSIRISLMQSTLIVLGESTEFILKMRLGNHGTLSNFTPYFLITHIDILNHPLVILAISRLTLPFKMIS